MTLPLILLATSDPFRDFEIIRSLLANGAIFGIVSFLGGSLFGGIAVSKHVFLRLISRRRNQMPMNIAKFLDYASSRILMRKVGGGYVFIHRLLLEYFAELDQTNEQVVLSEPVTDQVNRLADHVDTHNDAMLDTDSSAEQEQINP